MNRRELLQIAAAGSALLATRAVRAQTRTAPTPPTTPTKATPKMTIMTRPIPKSATKEQLPVVGLGTWQTFDIGNDKAERAQVADVLTKFFASGARVIDSSPMYGRAEAVTGDGLAAINAIGTPFLATKVWTSGKQDGIDQMKRSLRRLRAQTIDLMQVHNLVDYKTHLATLRDWKEEGTIRYLGVTHYQHDQFDLIEKLMKSEKLDFIQIPYSIVDRAAEKRVLPTAADTGTAVIVMTPFESGALFRQVKNKALPALAADLDTTSWAQFFLKFLIGHPAVTCPIPATRNAKHVLDNVGAGFGRIPNAKQRTEMAAALH